MITVLMAINISEISLMTHNWLKKGEVLCVCIHGCMRMCVCVSEGIRKKEKDCKDVSTPRF